MPSAHKLSEEDVQRHLAQLPTWQLAEGRPHKEFHFADFQQAFGFMAMAALDIEKLNHHPSWRNVYNRVTVDLHTHSADGLTELDFQLAAVLDGIANLFT